MPYCPQCLSEYRPGFTRCASCDVALVESLPPEMDLSEQSIKEALAGKHLVAITRGELAVIKETRSLLARRHIPSLMIKDEDSCATCGPPRLLLLVTEQDASRAAQVLEEQFRNMLAQEEGQPVIPADHETCPACGARVAEEQEECPECGLFIGKA